MPSGRSAADRLKALEQLKNDGLINEEDITLSERRFWENLSCSHPPRCRNEFVQNAPVNTSNESVGSVPNV